MAVTIPGTIVDDLCTAAGVRPTRCARIVLSPTSATFTVYEENEAGELIVDGDGDFRHARTRTVTVGIQW